MCVLVAAETPERWMMMMMEVVLTVALPGFESDSVRCEPEIALKRPIGMEYNRVVSENLFPPAWWRLVA